MDIYLYAIRLERDMSLEEQESMMRILPKARLRRLLRVKDPRLRQEPLCAYIALQFGLYELYGWHELPEMDYGKYGKPYFPDHPEVAFNLSHTRGAVLAGIHDHAIGVDIERVRPLSERVKRTMPPGAAEETFFDQWVERESRGKWMGTGVFIPEREQMIPPGERLIKVDTFEGYRACVCTHADNTELHVCRLHLNKEE